MNYEDEIVKAGRVTQVDKVTDLTEGYKPGVPFSVFLNPKEGSDVELGDVVTLDAELPYSSTAVEVPVVAGDWSPVVFVGLPTGAVDLTKVDVYAGIIK